MKFKPEPNSEVKKEQLDLVFCSQIAKLYSKTVPELARNYISRIHKARVHKS